MNCENILVIGAHFDDAELGCGGTMARFAAEGKKVYKLTLTDNKTDFKERNIAVSFKDSLADSAIACGILGVEELSDFPYVQCNCLTYSTEIMQRVEKIIFDKHIDTVFIHYRSDANQDHVAASRICETAARHCRNVLYYQSNGYVLNESFYPNFFVDISGYYDKKAAALSAYRGDHNRFERLFEVSLERTDIYGYANEVDKAEGFMVLKACM